MTELSRRRFLTGGLAAAGMAAVSPVGGALIGDRGAAATTVATPPMVPGAGRLRTPDSLPFPHLPPGTDTLPQIDHILVLMMENHSYDNWLGMLGRGPGQTPRGDGFQLNRKGLPTAANLYANSDAQHAFHMPTTCQLSGAPAQDWLASHTQFDGGANDGFVISGSGPVSMGYWTEADIPWSYSLASTFPLADRWFCSLLGQTDPNRRYLLAATSVGMVNDVFSQLGTPAPNGTIFERLNAHGITWRDYHGGTPSVLVFLKDPARRPENLQPMSQFYADAASGDLPGFAIIDPEFNNHSEENPQDIVLGESFAHRVVSAVMNSPAWPSTLLVFCYDEHGGYYDHVPPPPALAPDNIGPIVPEGESAYEGFGRYGFRVPAVVVSPWSKPNHVTSVIHDHTSVLAMVERKWNLPAMTWRDANAADLGDFLDLSSPAFLEPPTLTPPLDGPAQRACLTTGPGQIPPPGSVTPPHHHHL